MLEVSLSKAGLEAFMVWQKNRGKRMGSPLPSSFCQLVFETYPKGREVAVSWWGSPPTLQPSGVFRRPCESPKALEAQRTPGGCRDGCGRGLRRGWAL